MGITKTCSAKKRRAGATRCHHVRGTSGACNGLGSAALVEVNRTCSPILYQHDRGKTDVRPTKHMKDELERYVAVTNRCCTTSLVASRGPGLSMPPSFHPLPADVEPTAGEIIRDVTERLSGGGGGDGSGTRGGLFDELVFAGVGEPLLRWPVVKEVVLSLRSRHATLLRPRQASPTTTTTTTGTGAGTGTGNAGTAAGRPTPQGTMPIRLITNGLWPAAAVAGQNAGGFSPSVAVDDSSGGATQSLGRRRCVEWDGDGGGVSEGDGNDEAADGFVLAETRGGGSTSLADSVGSAAFMAREISEIFDSVSVALNTANPAQYEELMKPSAEFPWTGERGRDGAHALVCDLVEECAARGLPTECTVVDRDGVDVRRAQDLAAALGASCRVRPYFPK